jgi:hypothetical protein
MRLSADARDLVGFVKTEEKTWGFKPRLARSLIGAHELALRAFVARNSESLRNIFRIRIHEGQNPKSLL